MNRKILPANLAVILLEENGMTEEEAWLALDWADENGEYDQDRYNVVCMGGKTAGSIAYQITIQ